MSWIIAVRLLLLGCAPSPLLEPSSVEHPNVLLISVDDLNDWTGFLGGHEQARTPAMDRLARRSTLFTNAHCQAPVCTPSRASLFTGRYPSTTGMYFLTPSLTQVESLRDARTLTRRFREEGYETLGVGKLHHGNERPFFETYGGGMGGFGPQPKTKLQYPEGHPLWDWGPFPEHDEEMPDSKVASWAIERLNEPRERPFLLAVGFHRPHVPMLVPARWFELFDADDVKLPEVFTNDRDDLSPYALALTIGLPAPRHTWMIEHRQWRPAVHAYLASTAFVDDCVGRVLNALEASEHARDTIVVLFSDHGFHLGEKARWAKRSLWEESTRVPLMIARPGRDSAACSRAVGLIDIYPTLLELCGLKPDPHLEGESLRPWLDDPSLPRERPARTTFGPGNHALRDDHHRFVRYRDGSEELYDHRVDANEWHNLASDPASAERLAAFHRYLPHQEAELLRGVEPSAGYKAMITADDARRK